MVRKQLEPTVNDLKGAIDNLVAAIRTDKLWCAWRKAEEELASDAELTVMIARYNARMEAWDRQGAEETDHELVELAEHIQNHRLVREQSKARADITRFLQNVNVMLSEELGMDFASTAAPRRGGCCG